MSDNAWVLRGVDPETRQQAVDEAERLGVSLSDYLTDKVLRAAIIQQSVDDAAEPSNAPARTRVLPGLPGGTVGGGLDGALHALDSAVLDVAERVGELQDFAGDTAQALQQALQDTAEKFVSVERQSQQAAAARASENAAAHESLANSIAALGHHVQDVEACAQRAQADATALAGAHETLKYAVASDFSTFADEIAARVDVGLREVAASADAASAQADAAVAHLVVELRGVRESLEQSVAGGVDETRRRMHAVFKEATERMDAFSSRVDQVERRNALAEQQLQVRMADIEDSAQVALEETAETLRQAGAALAADLQRTAQDQQAALESVHGDLTNEIADLRERQQGTLARLKLLDAVVGGSANDIGALREQMLQRIGEAEQAAAQRAGQALSHASEQAEAVATQLAKHEAEAADIHFQLRADTERVEASTIAALEKLAGDIASSRVDAAEAVERVRADALSQVTELRDQQSGFGARLTIIDMALRAQSSLGDRIAKVEAATQDAAPGAKLAGVEAQVNVLRQAMAGINVDQAPQRIAELGERLEGYESRVSAMERLHATGLVENSTGAAPNEIVELEQRLRVMETRQTEALDTLRADIARFVSDNGRRLTALEAPEVDYNLAAEFDALRKRVEDRILGIEQRSVRTLDQVADTVAMLEQRFMDRQDGDRQSA